MLYSVRLSFLFLGLIAFVSCNSPAPPVEEQEEVSLTAAPERMKEDQTRGTRNANPETVAPERLEDVEVRTAPVTKQLEKAVESKMPAPERAASVERAASPEPENTASVPSTAPAAAPEKPDGEEKEAGPVLTADTSQEPPIPENTAPDHTPWNTLLQQYVNDRGRVDYAALKRNESKLDAYLTSLEKEAPRKSWSRNERLAYWLNAYNAYTFKLILNNYPTKSITDLHGGKPWDVKWIEIGNNTYSLNQIEHEIIRPRFGDPRIHFAVVCAAQSCPPLANEAFTSRNLNSLLETRTRQFINNSTYNDTGSNPRISKVFDWYAEDFGDVKAYLNKYLKTPLPADAELGYMEYDWSLNDQ